MSLPDSQPRESSVKIPKSIYDFLKQHVSSLTTMKNNTIKQLTELEKITDSVTTNVKTILRILNETRANLKIEKDNAKQKGKSTESIDAQISLMNGLITNIKNITDDIEKQTSTSVSSLKGKLNKVNKEITSNTSDRSNGGVFSGITGLFSSNQESSQPTGNVFSPSQRGGKRRRTLKRQMKYKKNKTRGR